MFIKSIIGIISFMFFMNSALAGVPSIPATVVTSAGGSQTNTENRAFFGLVWALQKNMSLTPDLNFGFRSLRVKSNDNVNGGEVSVRFMLKDSFSFDSTRLSFVGGERDLLANLGIGFSATNSSFLLTGAIQGPYVRFGSDYDLLLKKLSPYIEAVTLDKPNKVRRNRGSTSFECNDPNYTTLNGQDCEFTGGPT